MKKIFGILSVLFILSSCNGGTVRQGSMDEEVTQIIEGCEYIYSSGIGLRSRVHKGNCSNPIHKCNCGDIDTVFVSLPVDSAEIAVGYLRSRSDI
jgi:hypothetical protein